MDTLSLMKGKTFWTMGALAALGIFISIAYSPLVIGDSEFLGDDSYYILNNSFLQHLDLRSLCEIWTKHLEFDYFPVTLTSFALDYALWGLDPRMFHVTNIIIFFCIGITAFSLSVRVNRNLQNGENVTLYAAALAGVLLPLLHPTQVESVAAISHRKDLLSVLFGLLAFRFYISEPGKGRLNVMALVCMALAQLSKGTAIFLPFVLLAYELFYRKGQNRDKRVFMRLVPFFIISGLIFSYQFSVARDSGVIKSPTAISLGMRVGGGMRTITLAAKKFILPVQLTYDYDIKWPDSLSIGSEWIVPLFIVALLICLLYRKNYPYLFLWLFILVPFLPYSNIIPLKHVIEGNLVYYDHYLLFPLAAASLLVTRWLLSVAVPWRRPVIAGIAVLLILFVFQDVRLSSFWRSGESLYQRSIALAPGISRPYYFLGKIYLDKGRYAEALALFTSARAMNQPYPTVDVYQWMGQAYASLGRYSEAAEYYRMHLAFKPDDKASLQNLSSSLIMLKRDEEARTVIQRLLSLYPADPGALANLSILERRKTGKGAAKGLMEGP
ncbi:MAG: tetratricopeptide repeat protein [Thermodesulfovibrionales bacterium]